jgi:hypothetical protein
MDDFEQSFREELSVIPRRNNVSIRLVHSGIKIYESVKLFCGKPAQASWLDKA